MPTTLAIRFPFGRYHATPWGRNVNEGLVEWPPSPWRILRSLYATWKARAPEIPEDVVHETLDALATAPCYELPPYAVAHTRHYMPDTKTGTDKAFDAFAVIDRESDLLVIWPTDLGDAQRASLSRLCDLLPYLGRAESICEMRLVDTSQGANPETTASGAAIDPVSVEGEPPDRVVRVLVPDRPLDIDALTVRTTTVRRGRHLDPPGSSWVDYPAPAPADQRRHSSIPQAATATATAVRWSIASPARPARTAAVVMADVLRQAVMSRYGRRFEGSTSSTLAGKGQNGSPLTGHTHAHYLAFGCDPRRGGDTRLDTLVVWAPGGFDDRDLEALGDLRMLTGRSFLADFRPCRLGLEGIGAVGEVASELVGPAMIWESYTPFASSRHAGKKQSWENHVVTEVRREMGYRGLPEPRSVELLRESDAGRRVSGGWLDFRRHRARSSLREAYRATGVRVVFETAVEGPLCLGALSHYGLGLFLPTDKP